MTVLTQDDLPAVAAIHAAAFPESALTALGVEALRRYYAWQLASQNVFAPGVKFSGQIVGFCFGGVFRGALSGYLNANRAYLARRVLLRPHLLANPLFRERLAEGLRALRGTFSVRAAHKPSVHEVYTTNKPRSFGILAIGVMPEFQSMGAGASLMARAEALARDGGFERMSLTVHPMNTRAVQFYERLGWHKATDEGTWQGRMHKALTE